MEIRTLGRSDLRLSLIGLGCNNFGARIDYARSELVVRRALDLGITHFDTADIYGKGASEEFLGRALGPQRKDVVVATKFGQRMGPDAPAHRGASSYVKSAVEASLKRLGSEWIDLLLMHVPDRSTPIEETLRALEDLRSSGKVRYLAASNFSAAELSKADEVSRHLAINGFVGTQDELSVLRRGNEQALVPTMEKLGLSLLPYRPLAGGSLTGKYRRGVALPQNSRYAGARAGAEQFLDPNWERIERLRDYAEARGHTLIELAMSWLARRPIVVSIVTGATSPAQVDTNVRSTDWAMSDEEVRDIDRISATPKRRPARGLAGLLPRRSWLARWFARS